MPDPRDAYLEAVARQLRGMPDSDIDDLIGRVHGHDARQAAADALAAEVGRRRTTIAADVVQAATDAALKATVARLDEPVDPNRDKKAAAAAAVREHLYPTRGQAAAHLHQ